MGAFSSAVAMTHLLYWVLLSPSQEMLYAVSQPSETTWPHSSLCSSALGPHRGCPSFWAPLQCMAQLKIRHNYYFKQTKKNLNKTFVLAWSLKIIWPPSWDCWFCKIAILAAGFGWLEHRLERLSVRVTQFWLSTWSAGREHRNRQWRRTWCTQTQQSKNACGAHRWEGNPVLCLRASPRGEFSKRLNFSWHVFMYDSLPAM